jgi:hypothetical protein
LMIYRQYHDWNGYLATQRNLVVLAGSTRYSYRFGCGADPNQISGQRERKRRRVEADVGKGTETISLSRRQARRLPRQQAAISVQGKFSAITCGIMILPAPAVVGCRRFVYCEHHSYLMILM